MGAFGHHLILAPGGAFFSRSICSKIRLISVTNSSSRLGSCSTAALVQSSFHLSNLSRLATLRIPIEHSGSRVNPSALTVLEFRPFSPLHSFPAVLLYYHILRLPRGRIAMSSESRPELNRLCAAVQQEKDPAKVTELLEELNEFLERREQKLSQFNAPKKQP